MILKRVRTWRDYVAPWLARASRPVEADLAQDVSQSEREAEWRWSLGNEENRKRGCPCGKASQVAQEFGDVHGTVPFLWWTCEDCMGATSFAGSVPQFKHPIVDGVKCPQSTSMSARIGHPPHEYSCPHRTH